MAKPPSTLDYSVYVSNSHTETSNCSNPLYINAGQLSLLNFFRKLLDILVRICLAFLHTEATDSNLLSTKTK
jgi:hypothetical protein